MLHIRCFRTAQWQRGINQPRQSTKALRHHRMPIDPPTNLTSTLRTIFDVLNSDATLLQAVGAAVKTVFSVDRTPPLCVLVLSAANMASSSKAQVIPLSVHCVKPTCESTGCGGQTAVGSTISIGEVSLSSALPTSSSVLVASDVALTWFWLSEPSLPTSLLNAP